MVACLSYTELCVQSLTCCSCLLSAGGSVTNMWNSWPVLGVVGPSASCREGQSYNIKKAEVKLSVKNKSTANNDCASPAVFFWLTYH